MSLWSKVKDSAQKSANKVKDAAHKSAARGAQLNKKVKLQRSLPRNKTEGAIVVGVVIAPATVAAVCGASILTTTYVAAGGLVSAGAGLYIYHGKKDNATK